MIFQDGACVRSAQHPWFPLPLHPIRRGHVRQDLTRTTEAPSCPGIIASSRGADAGPRGFLLSACWWLGSMIKSLKWGGRSLTAAGLTQSIISIPCTFYKLVWSSAPHQEVPHTCFAPAVHFCPVLVLFSCVLWICKHISQAVSRQVKSERKYILNLIICQKTFKIDSLQNPLHVD